MIRRNQSTNSPKCWGRTVRHRVFCAQHRASTRILASKEQKKGPDPTLSEKPQKHSNSTGVCAGPGSALAAAAGASPALAGECPGGRQHRASVLHTWSLSRESAQRTETRKLALGAPGQSQGWWWPTKEERTESAPVLPPKQEPTAPPNTQEPTRERVSVEQQGHGLGADRLL